VNESDAAYRVFIVRYWHDRETSEDTPSEDASRFVLEIPRTGERYGFTSAATLLAALHRQLETSEKNQNHSA
jgi:hypothetical protein